MAGHTIVLSEHRFHYVQECFDRMVFMENGVISEIYSREDALSLSEGRLAAMGLRPFAVPALRVGGAFVSGQEDMLQVSSISWTMDHRQILDRISFSAVRGKILAIARSQRRGEILALPGDHRLTSGFRDGLPGRGIFETEEADKAILFRTAGRSLPALCADGTGRVLSWKERDA